MRLFLKHDDTSHDPAHHESHHPSPLPLALAWLAFLSLLLANSLPPSIPRPVVIFLIGSLTAGALQITGDSMHEIIELSFPFLLFGEALATEIAPLKRYARHVVLQSVVGYLLSAVVLCAGLSLVLDWPFYTHLSLTAVLLATDNGMGHAILHALDVSPKVLALVGGEGMFSDVAVVTLFTTASAAWLEDATLDTPTVALAFLKLGLGGASMGVMMGNVTLFLIEHISSSDSQIIASLVCAVTSFGLGEVLGFSGAVASVCAGLVLKWKVSMRLVDRTSFQTTFRMIATYAEAVCVFLCGACLVGPFFRDDNELDIGMMVAIGFMIYGICYLARFAGIMVMRPIGNLVAPFVSVGEATVLGLAGCKGKVGIALSLAVLTKPGVEPQEEHAFLFYTSLVVLISHVVNSVLLPWVAKHAGLTKGSAVSAVKREIVFKALKMRYVHHGDHDVDHSAHSAISTASVQDVAAALREIFVYIFVRELDHRNFETKTSTALLDAALYALEKQSMADAQYLIKSLKSSSQRRPITFALYVEIYESAIELVTQKYVNPALATDEHDTAEAPLLAHKSKAEKILSAWAVVSAELDGNLSAVYSQISQLSVAEMTAAREEIKLRATCADTAERVEKVADLVGHHTAEHLIEELTTKISTFQQLRKLSEEVDESDSEDGGVSEDETERSNVLDLNV